MTEKQYKAARLVTVAVVAATVSLAVTSDNFLLALGGVIGGMIIMRFIMKRYGKVIHDERVDIVSGKSARISYTVTVMTLTLLSIYFTTLGDRRIDPYVESLGVIFGMTAILAITLYAISFVYFNHRYGGDR